MAEAASQGRAKRETKKVESFVVEVKEKEEFVIKAGAGTKFGDIVNIKVHIEKATSGSDELKNLHRVCFSRPGVKTMVKRNLREFSGLTITGVELERKQAAIAKLDGKVIKTCLTLCDLSTSGTKVRGEPPVLPLPSPPAPSPSLPPRPPTSRALAHRSPLGRLTTRRPSSSS